MIDRVKKRLERPETLPPPWVDAMSWWQVEEGEQAVNPTNISEVAIFAASGTEQKPTPTPTLNLQLSTSWNRTPAG